MSDPTDRTRVAVDVAVRRIAVGYRIVGAVWVGGARRAGHRGGCQDRFGCGGGGPGGGVDGAYGVAAGPSTVTNAAVHADSERVSVYAEAEAGTAAVRVRDRGVGFDPDALPDDRRGVRDSILGRVRRRGGQATIRSSPGGGAVGAPRARAMIRP